VKIAKRDPAKNVIRSVVVKSPTTTVAMKMKKADPAGGRTEKHC
jgi:hypothetical protein